jgi:hypothetical protein
MIAPVPSPPIPPDIASGRVTFRVAADGEAADVVPALARLLITIDKRRRERLADQAAAGGEEEGGR